jgi:hypothetical protein
VGRHHLKTESQTPQKIKESIQYRVLEKIKEESWPNKYDVVFDDDDTNEAADIVALRVAMDELVIHFFHCKYSKELKPGARVEDLYEVCGQAQRSVQWRAHVEHLLAHLIKRDVDRVKRINISRFERGSRKTVAKIKRQLPHLHVKSEVFVVQPGVSKEGISTKQLELLGATDTYLMETYQMCLNVIASE